MQAKQFNCCNHSIAAKAPNQDETSLVELDKTREMKYIEELYVNES